MLKRQPRECTSRARRFGRTIAAIVSTSLLAPAAVVGVSVIAAAPASALPVRTFVVAGDADARNGGAWTFHGADYSQLRSIITNAANFGPTGTVKTASFQIGTPVTTITDGNLAGIDVFFSGAVADYTQEERDAFVRFVNRGGMLILNSNSIERHAADAFGYSVREPRAIFEPGDHPGIQLTNPANSEQSGPYAAPSPATAVGTHPIIQGPFGTVTTFQNWHTVTGFTVTPPGATTLAALTARCTAATSFCSGPAVVTPPSFAYNQDFDNVPVLSVIPPITVSGVRHGAVIVTSDVDTFSNHDLADADPAPGEQRELYADPMLPGNETLAKNVFAFIANELTDGYSSLAAPTRIMSTRDGVGVAQSKLTAGATRTLQVTGANGIPANATAGALNVTVTNPTASSFVSVYPTGTVTGTPTTSNLNFGAGQTIANMVVVSLPASGQLTFFNESGSVDVLADAVGFYSQATGDRFNPVSSPDRVLDTRGGAPVGANTARSVLIRGAGRGFVPAEATAVVLNVTSVRNTAGGFLTVYAGDLSAPPNASNLNMSPGVTTPNLVVARLSPSGTINVYNFAGTTDVLVDVLGYFVAGSGGGSFGPLTPSRVLDTRQGGGAPVGPGGVVELTVLGRGGVPASGVRSVLLNVTAAAPSADSFITVWPEGTRPEASNLNVRSGQNVPNLVVVGIGADGKVRLFNQAGTVHLLADVMGYYS